MRLSLRTLLAFEDNIFDNEQHRQLERIIPQHDAAAMTLGRIRNVVRDSRLGVPGLVDRREELDPNIVAEYLDHQMSSEMQERFETYCLSSDKYLAEVASIHQILANVLGEPARTSRDCRLRCYNLHGEQQGASLGTPQGAQPEPDFEQRYQAIVNMVHGPEYGGASNSVSGTVPHDDRDFMGRSTHRTGPVDAGPMNGDSSPVSHTPRSWFGSLVQFLGVSGKKRSESALAQPVFSASVSESQDKSEEKGRKGILACIMCVVLGTGGFFNWEILQDVIWNRIFDRVKTQVTQNATPSEAQPWPAGQIPGQGRPPAAIVIPVRDPAAAAAALAAIPKAAVLPQNPGALLAPPAVPAPVQTPVSPSVPEAAKAVVQETAPPLPQPISADIPQPVLADPFMSTPLDPNRLEIPETSGRQALNPAGLKGGDSGNQNAYSISTLPSTPVTAERTADPFLSAQSAEPVQTVGWNRNNNADTKNVEPSVFAGTDSREDVESETTTQGASPEPANAAVVDAITPEAEQETLDGASPALVSMPLGKPETESVIAFQPISAPPKKNAADQDADSENATQRFKTNAIQNASHRPVAHGVTDGGDAMADNAVVHPASTARQFGQVVPVAQILESKPRALGRARLTPEPAILFSAASADDPWTLQELPVELFADQYLLTVTPFRCEVDVADAFRIEMVGDAKISILPLDVNGVPGIFVDYGRLVIRRQMQNSTPSHSQPLRIQTEEASGVLNVGNLQSVVFVDTFAEVVSETKKSAPTNSPQNLQTRSPKTCPILGFAPVNGDKISWRLDGHKTPLIADRQSSVLLKQDEATLGRIQNLPGWLSRTPLPSEGRALAEACYKIFKAHAGNSEAALQALIAQQTVTERFFGYRLWGDLGRFDVPLALMAEAKPEEENLRQVLVPYFREVMKRDAETVQRLADAIEEVQR